MLHLVLFRHAKSSWAAPDLHDHDRPLNERGERDAPRMGEFIGKLGFRLDLILCSTAERARETLRLALPGAIAKGVPAITFDQALYDVDERLIRHRIAEVHDSASTVLVVGHNPGMHDLTCHLATSGPEGDPAPIVGKFPTAAVAVLKSSQSNWRTAVQNSWQLETFMTPKRLIAAR